MLTPQDLLNIIEMFFESNNLNFENFKNELIKQIKGDKEIEISFKEAFKYCFECHFSDNYGYHEIFDNFLIWYESVEGYDYWSKIDNKFKKEFEKYKKLYLNKMFED
jgi:hypothetical protein